MADTSELIAPGTRTIADALIQPCPTLNGATATYGKAMIDGKVYFVKQLRETLMTQSPSYRQAFIKEYEVGHKLNSPYVVSYEKITDDENGVRIWQEYVDGATLQDIDADKIDIYRFSYQLLSALNYLHSMGVVHMDLKPANIMFTRTGGNVKLLDLGFCYADSYPTSIGCNKAFGAPEVQNGTLPDNCCVADIYSFGKILHYVAEKTGKHLNKCFGNVARKCVEADGSKRYQSANEVMKALCRDSRFRQEVLPSQTSGIKRKMKGWHVVAFVAILLSAVAFVPFLRYGVMNMAEKIRHKLGFVNYDFVENGIYYNVLSDGNVEVTTDDFEHGGAYHDDITIPDTIEHNGQRYAVVGIASRAFYRCPKLVAVVVPQKLQSIGDSAFCRCDNLATFNMPDNVMELGVGVFRNSEYLRSVRLSENLTTLPEYCFSGCRNLASVELPSGLKRLERDAFGCCVKLQEVVIPEGVEKIGRGVFWENSRLKRVVIPSSVCEIGDFVFWHCDSLSDIYIDIKEPLRITNIFNGVSPLLHVPEETEGLYQEKDEWNKLEVTSRP